MEEAYLDDAPAVNFDTATLEITKDTDVVEFDKSTVVDRNATVKKDKESGANVTEQTSSSKNLSNFPFKRLDVHSYFSDRNEVIEKALKDCQANLLNDNDEDIIGSWLLTEISLWDAEKERLVLLTKKALFSVKYDFISLNILESNVISLSNVDTLVAGELIYPSASIVPRLSGLAEGLSSIIHCAVRQDWSSFAACSSLTQFEPRKRHMSGMRLMWNNGQPLSLNKKWNPFAKNIPWITYASHPLFWYKGSEAEKARFDVEGLHSSILSFLSDRCNVISGPIIIENYCGVGALVHNRNDLGFFKIRGKVSF